MTKMELWDIYDEKKRRTGRTMVRGDWNMKPGEYHLSVLGVIRRPDGKFLLTKRAMDKEWAPGHWEVSGGAALAGEDSRTAILREIREETGLDVSGCPGELLFTYRRDNPEKKDNYFVDVYRFEMDFAQEDICLQREEAEGYRIASLEEIDALGSQGIFLHYQSIRQAFSMERLRLRSVSEADCELLFAWANDRETRRNSFRTEKIEYGEHAAWFQRKIQEDTCQMFILLCDEKEAGQIRLDWQSDEDVARISYVIAPEYRGMGLGSEILRLVEPFASGKTLQGRVRRENVASAKCFEKNGYAMAEREHWLEFRKKIAMK